jgi:hypothetical protein
MKAFIKCYKDFNLLRGFIFLIKSITTTIGEKKVLAPLSELIMLEFYESRAKIETLNRKEGLCEGGRTLN